MGSSRRHRKSESDTDSIFFMYQPNGRIKGEFASPPNGVLGIFDNNSSEMLTERNCFREEEGFWISRDGRHILDPSKI